MKNRIKIKDSLYILEDKSGKYVFIFTATRRIKAFSVDSLVREVVDSLEVERDEEELIDALSGRYAPKDIFDCLNALEKERIIRRYSPEKIKERHNRQILFIDELTSSWNETKEIQERLENSVIGVFGIGGIGTWIVNGLHQIGIGEIRISDPDKVNMSNLNRQLFFATEDIGKYKTDVIQSKLPDANIIPFQKRISRSESLEEIIAGCTFLVNCADSPSVVATTEIIDEYASQHKIPYCVAGGYNLHLGMVGPIIVPGETKTFQDFIDYQKRMDPLKELKPIRDIRQTGNLGPIAGAIANMQVMEIFKYLAGKGETNINRFAEIDFMNLDITWRVL